MIEFKLKRFVFDVVVGFFVALLLSVLALAAILVAGVFKVPLVTQAIGEFYFETYMFVVMWPVYIVVANVSYFLEKRDLLLAHAINDLEHAGAAYIKSKKVDGSEARRFMQAVVHCLHLGVSLSTINWYLDRIEEDHNLHIGSHHLFTKGGVRQHVSLHLTSPGGELVEYCIFQKPWALGLDF